MPTVVHFSPHPDDEVLGAAGALFALRDAGWRVVNVACSLGREDQRERRVGELREACRRARFDLRVDDVDPAVVLAELQPDLVVAPSPHDPHPFHGDVARQALTAVAAAGAPSVVWLWTLWGEPVLPSLALELTEERLAEIAYALEAHEGELARTDFRRLLRGRAEVYGVVGGERLHGYGAPALPFALVELLTELVLDNGRWHLGEPRVIAAGEISVAGVASAADVTDWLFEPSVSTRFGSRHA